MLRQIVNRFFPDPVRLTPVQAPAPAVVLLSLWILRAELLRVIDGRRADCTALTAHDVLRVLPSMIDEAAEEMNASAFAEQAARDEADGWPR